MMEPRRLLENGGTDAERALLDSARFDGPSDRAANRMLVALQALAPGEEASGAPPDAVASGSPHSFASATTALWTKVGLIGLVGLGAIGAGALVHRMGNSRTDAVDATAMRAPKTEAHEQPVARPVAVSGSGRIPAPSPVAVPIESRVASPPVPNAAVRRRADGTAESSLAAEIRILDAARAALDAHDVPAAQRAIDTYRRQFPQGRLSPEENVLRLAALVQRNDRAAAASLATRLLADDSYRAYEHRIRSLLREGGIEQPAP